VARRTTLGELVASIAHELNQPLAAISIDGGACQKWLAHEPPNLDKAIGSARRVVREAERASAVIKRLRALTANDSLRLEPLQINEPIEEMLMLMWGQLLSGGVAVRQELSSTLPPV
jgi:C4-dicarboxylate-specific signal transduction histidine kinase